MADSTGDGVSFKAEERTPLLVSGTSAGGTCGAEP